MSFNMRFWNIICFSFLLLSAPVFESSAKKDKDNDVAKVKYRRIVKWKNGKGDREKATVEGKNIKVIAIQEDPSVKNNGEKKVLFNNLSGIVFVEGLGAEGLGLYFGVQNGNADGTRSKIFVFDVNFNMKIVVRLKIKKKAETGQPGYRGDFEGITFMGMTSNNIPIFGIVNEVGELFVGPIDLKNAKKDEDLVRAKNLKFMTLKNKNFFIIPFGKTLTFGEANKGPEGVTYNSVTNRAIIAVEGNYKDEKDRKKGKKSVGIVSFELPFSLKDIHDKLGQTAEHVTDLNYHDDRSKDNNIKSKDNFKRLKCLAGKKDEDKYKVTDIAGVAYDGKTDLLYAVSDDSSTIYLVKMSNGELQGVIHIEQDTKDVKNSDDLLNMEGIFVMADGKIVIAREPNKFMVLPAFEKTFLKENE